MTNLKKENEIIAERNRKSSQFPIFFGTDLVEYGCDRSGALPAARERDDAVAAHVVAAALYGSAKDRRRVNLVSFKSHILKRFLFSNQAIYSIHNRSDSAHCMFTCPGHNSSLPPLKAFQMRVNLRSSATTECGPVHVYPISSLYEPIRVICSLVWQ